MVITVSVSELLALRVVNSFSLSSDEKARRSGLARNPLSRRVGTIVWWCSCCMVYVRGYSPRLSWRRVVAFAERCCGMAR